MKNDIVLAHLKCLRIVSMTGGLTDPNRRSDGEGALDRKIRLIELGHVRAHHKIRCLSGRESLVQVNHIRCDDLLRSVGQRIRIGYEIVTPFLQKRVL